MSTNATAVIEMALFASSDIEIRRAAVVIEQINIPINDACMNVFLPNRPVTKIITIVVKILITPTITVSNSGLLIPADSKIVVE